MYCSKVLGFVLQNLSVNRHVFSNSRCTNKLADRVVPATNSLRILRQPPFLSAPAFRQPDAMQRVHPDFKR